MSDPVLHPDGQAHIRGLMVITAVLAMSAVAGRGEEPVAEANPPPADFAGLEFAELARVKVTSVSRSESTVAESPAAIFVITQEMIRRSGATVIPELFRMVPGMNVARIDGNKWAVSARGFNERFGGKLLVQIDGRTVYTPLFGGVYWDNVDYPLEDIERIEVIRGPGASVWGANAVNGVINIITKPAKDTQGGLLTAGGGTEERGFGSFRYGGKLGDDLFFRLYGKGYDRDEQFALGGSGDAWSGASGGLRLDWTPSTSDRVTLDAAYFHDVAGRKDLRPTTDPTSVVTLSGISFPNTFLNVEDEVSNGGHVLASWSHTLDDDSSWTLQAYWDRVERNLDNFDLDLRWDTFDLDFQHQFAAGGRQKIVWGMGYRYLDAFLGASGIDDGFTFTFPDPNRDSQVFSAFVQDQIRLVEDKLELTLGSKFEHNDFTGFEIQPTGRLLWTPTKRQTVWAAASRAVRTPTLSEDGVAVTLIPVFPAPGVAIFPQITGNRGFESEELWAYELGHRAQITDAFSTDVALFYNDYDKLRVFVPGSPQPGPVPGTSILPLRAENRMHGETYGVEMAATWQATDGWRIYGAYSLLKMHLHRDPGLAASAEAAEGQSPQQQVYLQSSWNLPHHVEIDLIGRFVDQLSGFNPSGAAGVPDGIGNYVSLDARLAWRPRNDLLLEIVGQNLLDNHHPEFGTSPSVRSPLVEIQRGVYGRVTWTF